MFAYILYSFISRASPKNTSDHVILGVLGYKPREFAAQMNLNLNNGWAIVRTFVDMVQKQGDEDGKFVIAKDPNKPVIRIYNVPMSTFEEDEDEGVAMSTVGEGEGDAE
jgi:translation initiation factor 3 subunit D